MAPGPGIYTVDCTIDVPPVLLALIDGPRAWMTPLELAHLIKEDLDHVTDVLCDLNVAGWVDVSDGVNGPIVTFTDEAITYLELSLVEVRGTFRWRRGNSDTQLHGLRPMPTIGDGDRIVYDPHQLSPEMEAMREEALAARAAMRRATRERQGLPLRAEDVPPPTILLTGPSLWPWTEDDSGKRPSDRCRNCTVGTKKKRVLKTECECGRNVRSGRKPKVCVGCRNGPLSKSTYCLRCRRWGWDPVSHPSPAIAEQSA